MDRRRLPAKCLIISRREGCGQGIGNVRLAPSQDVFDSYEDDGAALRTVSGFGGRTLPKEPEEASLTLANDGIDLNGSIWCCPSIGTSLTRWTARMALRGDNVQGAHDRT
jgi:hypothetical protein